MRGGRQVCDTVAFTARGIHKGETLNLGEEVQTLNEFFRKFAAKTSAAVGSAWAFILASVVILAWAVTGPVFRYSDTWQLVINTGTTIVTFLMVFLIQNTQNRDAKAIHLKLDEMIKATPRARNHMIDLDRLSDEKLRRLEAEYKRLCDEDETSGAGLRGVKEEVKERESERSGS
jgi:low affinity Fe/Cu permease